jgi:hypothetical protein
MVMGLLSFLAFLSRQRQIQKITVGILTRRRAKMAPPTPAPTITPGEEEEDEAVPEEGEAEEEAAEKRCVYIISDQGQIQGGGPFQ